MSILVVDDEPAIRESLVYALHRDGFTTMQADTLSAARQLFKKASLIILDLMLPDGSGLDFLKAVRVSCATPVIVLTSRDEEIERVVGLELGADDYVTKPFSPREVVARVRAVLRRVQTEGTQTPSTLIGPLFDISMDLSTRRAWIKDAELNLSKTEFDLLAILLQSPGRVHQREQLLLAVWGPDCTVLDRTVDVHLKSLRNKVKVQGGDPSVIETVRGVGYRFRELAG
jgi:DNA-binding response OmpR family regulator